MAKCQEMTTRNKRADPSYLTEDHLDKARRWGISPTRYAWVLKCPKGGNATPGSRSYFRRDLSNMNPTTE
jgi:hypothetical protein